MLGQIMDNCDPESAEFRQNLERDFIYLCTLGVEDKIRKGAKESILSIKSVPDDPADDEDE